MKYKKGQRYSVESVEKRKKSKRDVLSYEDVPLEEYQEEKYRISKDAVKKILIAVAVLVVVGLIVFAISNRENLTCEKIGNWVKYDLFGSHDNGYPVQLTGTNVAEGNFISNGDICYVSDTSYQAFTKAGNEEGYNQHSFSSPVLRTSGDYVLIYNLGGNGYVTGKKSKLNSIKDTDQYILCGDINSKGAFCIVTQADGYLSKLTAYNKDEELLYSYYFSDYYIQSVAINEDGNGAVACGITGDNGSLSSVAYVLSFSSEQPVATHSLQSNIIYQTDYLTNSKVCMIGSDASYTLNTSNNNLNAIEYDKMELTNYDIDPDTDCFVLSLSRSGDGRMCSIEYFNSDGSPQNVNDTDYAVDSISLYKGRIAILSGSTAYLFDTNGNEVSSADPGNGAKAIRLAGADSAYILGINEIRMINF